MSKMKVAYVSGPISADTSWQLHQNIEAAKKVAAHLWKLGYSVICPHANTAFFGGVVPYEQFIAGDLAILDRLDRNQDCLVLMDGSAHSNGAMQELRHAYRARLHVFRYPDDLRALEEFANPPQAKCEAPWDQPDQPDILPLKDQHNGKIGLVRRRQHQGGGLYTDKNGRRFHYDLEGRRHVGECYKMTADRPDLDGVA